MTARKWLCAILVSAVAGSAVLIPITAGAQAPPPPPPPAVPMTPPPPPPPPAVPMTPPPRPAVPVTGPPTPPSTIVVVPPPPPPMQSMQPPTAAPEAPEVAPSTGARIGAGVLNVVYLPGRAIVCGAGTIVAAGFMLATFGSAYREAVSFFNEGCRGSWMLTPEEVAAIPKRVQLEY